MVVELPSVEDAERLISRSILVKWVSLAFMSGRRTAYERLLLSFREILELWEVAPSLPEILEKVKTPPSRYVRDGSPPYFMPTMKINHIPLCSTKTRRPTKPAASNSWFNRSEPPSPSQAKSPALSPSPSSGLKVPSISKHPMSHSCTLKTMGITRRGGRRCLRSLGKSCLGDW